MLNTSTRMAIVIFLTLCLGSLHAQTKNPALDYLRKSPETFGVGADDVRDLRVRDDYRSPDGTRHVYVNQRLNGHDIHNAQASVHLKEGRLVHTTSTLVADLATLALESPTAPAFSAQNAVVTAAAAVSAGFAFAQSAGNDGEVQLFNLPGVSDDYVRARLVYLPGETGLSLEWRVVFDTYARGGDYWLVFIDATTGDVTATDKLTLSGHFHEQRVSDGLDAEEPVSEQPAHDYLTHSHAGHTHAAAANPFEAALPEYVRNQMLNVESSAYRVVPFGEESPGHGNFTVEVNPYDTLASPFGWHDADGMAGAEFTITRGNNVHAYPDRETGDDNNNTPDAETADGGAALNFIFPYNQDSSMDANLEAGITQLFYTTNKIHDWLWHAGFDEAAGNFQVTNYTGQGRGSDEIRAEMQDGSGRNNANFGTPADGSRPRMQMMIMDGTSSSMQVTAPVGIADTFSTGTADFGASILTTNLSGTLALATDDSAVPDQACFPITSDVNGKIALIRRGNCLFEEKARNAQAAGAIGAIICSNENQLLNMTGPGNLGVTIPVVLITRSDCAPLRQAVANGEDVAVDFSFVQKPDLASEFDAGIVAHEIGHGVSTRIVGGPSSAFCLRNDEQMGEGWSDFFSLACSPRTLDPNADGTQGRGIGSWAFGRPLTSAGIRSQPYSTDMSINDKTYNDAIFTGFGAAPHPVGEVWNAALWDVYWYFVDTYGFDDDLIQGDGGNNMAVELVVEALKFTPCSPGFVGGRNGILAADEALHGGIHRCDLYEIFARRGIGFDAVEGSTDDRTDNDEGFETSPYCIGRVEMTKEYGNVNIDAGDDISVGLTLYSYRVGLTKNIQVTDEIPAGMMLVAGSVEGVSDFTQDGNQLIFRIDQMELDDEIFIDYKLATDPLVGSTNGFFDGAEDGDDNWNSNDLIEEIEPDYIPSFWDFTDTTPYAGDAVFYYANVGSAQDQGFSSDEPIPMIGDNPHLRFFTQYNTEPGWDGGVVEYSLDDENWTRVLPADIKRGAYRGEVAPNATDALLGEAFWGRSGGYDEIMVDMSALAGEDVFVRFRFISDANTPGVGWWVDNIEVVDVVNFDPAARLTSDEGDDLTVRAGDLGVVVYNPETTSTNDPVLGLTDVEVFPNPAAEVANVRINTELPGRATVQLLSIDGRLVDQRGLELRPGTNQTVLPTGQLPAGIYVVRVLGAEQIRTVKLTVE